MLRSSLVPAAVLLACACAQGQVTLEFLPDGFGITDISYDGSVVVGNSILDGIYETARWTEATGWVRLGSPTVPYIGTGAGLPGVSWDGSRVSATIINEDLTVGTQGIWADGLGWTELMPPLAPDGILLDQYYGSAWDISGDGQILTGFYWRDPQGGAVGPGCPCTSTIPGGPVALPTTNSGRVNACDYFGDVVAGWAELPNGTWQPTAWRNGVKMTLTPTVAFCEAYGINADGSVIVGQTYNPLADRRDPARWDWNGSEYVETNLGVLPGTPQTMIAQIFASSVSADGSIIVGTNRFQDNGPFSNQTGFVWTAQDGMRDIVAIMADAGAPFPANFIVENLVISADGNTIAGVGLDTNETQYFHYQSFIIRFTPPPSCVGDLDDSGTTDVLDFAVFGPNFGATGLIPYTNSDLDGDGDVDIFDFALFTGSFGCSVLPN